jgi:DNA-binding transcriptional ArsR family regulator
MPEPASTSVAGDADIAVIGAAVADAGRARILQALADGRALPASVLAGEAGVAPSTASGHLAMLLDTGLVQVEQHGRHRYYRLSGPQVGELLEALSRLAPRRPIRSLREGTRAEALRTARTCYDHLAGRLGTSLMAALLERGVLEGGDGGFDPRRVGRDRLSAPGGDVDYRLTERGAEFLSDFGIDFDGMSRSRPLIRYCVDWSEQRHHLAGALGAAIADRLFELGWIERLRTGRAVRVTDLGRRGLRERFGVEG